MVVDRKGGNSGDGENEHIQDVLWRQRQEGKKGLPVICPEQIMDGVVVNRDGEDSVGGNIILVYFPVIDK